ncbi:bifunctional DNA primase/polymerase [Streptomyces sp. NPDC047108]|uniref:bifunctional DNA primase/polymerase n=1 Tax=Streptomyces sp. NPDC047108 TaxID=3155025 RepID=UPI0034083D8A
MREILGRRRRLLPRRRRSGKPDLLTAALTCATAWQWPVLPGVGLQPGGSGAYDCACPHPDCVVPGAHPFDPGLLAATTDGRMVRWWWENRPKAPIVLATGGRAPCAVSLPAVAASQALADLDAMGVRIGPVVATPTRWSILVAPYSLEVLGELLHQQEWVPGSLRFHGDGGYVVLPPSQTGLGLVRWEREPQPASEVRAEAPASGRRLGKAAAKKRSAEAGDTPWLPDVATVVDALVEASTRAPGGGSRLAY